jgi:hypothetical protein
VPKFVIQKDSNGRFQGLGPAGHRAYMKFRFMCKEAPVGATLSMAYTIPRSLSHHRYFFASVTELLGMQERFDELKPLLEWLKVGAGHVDFVPGIDGQLVALPRSIDWESLEEKDFTEFHQAMRQFLWTPHAQAYLWPHLNTDQRYAMVDKWSRT